MVQQAKLALYWETMCFRQVKGLQNTQPLFYETKGLLSPDTLISSQIYPDKIGQEYERRIRLHTTYDTKHTEEGTGLCIDKKHYIELFLYRVILSVLDPRKCECLKDYSLHFENAYMTTYLAS